MSRNVPEDHGRLTKSALGATKEVLDRPEAGAGRGPRRDARSPGTVAVETSSITCGFGYSESSGEGFP